MSKFAKFMKSNKRFRENVKYVVTESLTDEKGNGLEWELKPLTTNESEDIRESSTIEIPVKGKVGVFRPRVDTKKYIAKMLVKSVVFPDLNDAELQDSYGVMNAEDLIRAMVDNPNEYNKFTAFVQEMNGFSNLDDDVKEAKN